MKKCFIFSAFIFVFLIGCMGCASTKPQPQPVHVETFTVTCDNIIKDEKGITRTCGYKFTPTTTPRATCPSCHYEDVLVPPETMRNTTPQNYNRNTDNVPGYGYRRKSYGATNYSGYNNTNIEHPDEKTTTIKNNYSHSREYYRWYSRKYDPEYLILGGHGRFYGGW